MKTKLKVIETKKVILKNTIEFDVDSKISNHFVKVLNELNQLDLRATKTNELDKFDDNFKIGDVAYFENEIKLDEKRTISFMNLIKIDDSSEVLVCRVDDKNYLSSDNRKSIETLVNDYKIFGKIEDEIVVS